jgi:hypothetical protein
MAVGHKFYLILPEGRSSSVYFQRWDVTVSASARLARHLRDDTTTYELWRVEIPLWRSWTCLRTTMPVCAT